jgi:hypothetical protein
MAVAHPARHLLRAKDLVEPLTTARTSLAMSCSSCASPEPPRVTSSCVAGPLARSAPLPDSVTVRLGVSMPVAATTPLPVRVSASSDGIVISTLIGLSVVKLPTVFPITRLPLCTSVVTRSSKLSSARTTTDCFSPTRIVTTLLPASSTALNDASSRVCVAATPDPWTPLELDEPWKTSYRMSSTTATAIRRTRMAASANWWWCGARRPWSGVGAIVMAPPFSCTYACDAVGIDRGRAHQTARDEIRRAARISISSEDTCRISRPGTGRIRSLTELNPG